MTYAIKNFYPIQFVEVLSEQITVNHLLIFKLIYFHFRFDNPTII